MQTADYFFFRFRLVSTNSTQSNFLFHTLQNSRQITLHLSNFQIVSHELCTYITYLSTFHNTEIIWVYNYLHLIMIQFYKLMGLLITFSNRKIYST